MSSARYLPLHRLAAFALLLGFLLPLVAGAKAPETTTLVDLESVVPDIELDMRYATDDNFTGHMVYPVERAFLVEPAARALAKVQADLRGKGYGLRILDAYRPLEVQRIFWKLVPDPKYVANPKTGSRHNRGASVDVTLHDAMGNECEMPTLFDDFSERAAAFHQDATPTARRHRQILQAAMRKHGFRILESEWWHFDYGEWKDHPLLDLDLDELALRAQNASGGTPMQDWRIPAADLKTYLATCSLKGISQLMLVVPEKEGDSTAMVQFFEKKNDEWVRVMTSRKASIGRKGVARPGAKREGDGRSPHGLYAIGSAFGYEASVTTKLPYACVTEEDVWVDDPQAPDYNRLVKRADTKAKSFEDMRRKDHMYKYGLVVEYNTAPIVPGHGSAIFVHIHSAPGKPTAGCVAFSEDRMKQILAWLDPGKKPHIAIGTRETLLLKRP